MVQMKESEWAGVTESRVLGVGSPASKLQQVGRGEMTMRGER